MKTTRKEYLAKTELRKSLNYKAQEARYTNDYETEGDCIEKREELDESYFNRLNTVLVSYNIGSRSYYRSVAKIGKGYYQHGNSMTAGRGYWGIEEIAEITPKMEEEMMADAYYY